jgi:exodeoxyribonuclease-3
VEKQRIRLISWNVNGLRACLGRGFEEFLAQADADALCLQEIKLSEGQLETTFPGYHTYWNYAQKKGYSGTALFTRREPMQVTFGIGIPEHDQEGRVITAEFEDYFLVVCYTPNSQRGLPRLPYRMTWERDFQGYLRGLDAAKPVVLCGDLNVAHQEIDIKNASANRRNAGFTDEERGQMTALLAADFVDSFRHLYPDKKDAYSWWSYMGGARDRNVGWRLDYFIVSRRLVPRIQEAAILAEVTGSDHCPVALELEQFP